MMKHLRMQIYLQFYPWGAIRCKDQHIPETSEENHLLCTDSSHLVLQFKRSMTQIISKEFYEYIVLRKICCRYHVYQHTNFQSEDTTLYRKLKYSMKITNVMQPFDQIYQGKCGYYSDSFFCSILYRFSKQVTNKQKKICTYCSCGDHHDCRALNGAFFQKVWVLLNFK